MLSIYFPPDSNTCKQRLKEMKQMSRDPLAAAKARKAEKRADEKSGGITIKPVTIPSADSKPNIGFKKGGFKNAFAVAESEDVDVEVGVLGGKKEAVKEVKVAGWESARAEVESESDGDWGDYDPRRPTGCGEGCVGRV